MTAMALVLLAGGAASAQERGHREGGREGRGGGDRAERMERRDMPQRDGAQRDGGGRGDREQDAPRVRDRSDDDGGERRGRGDGGPRGEERRERPQRPPEARPVAVPDGAGVVAQPERRERPHRPDPDQMRRDQDRRERGDNDRRDDRRWDNDRRGDDRRDNDRPGFSEPSRNGSWDRFRRGDANWGRRWTADERRRWDNDDRDRDRRRGDHRVWTRGHSPFSYASRNRYRVSIWIAPAGYYSRYWRDGDFLPFDWYGPRYRLSDWWAYDLPWPPPGYDWVRIGDDVLLVDRYSGRIVQVVRNVFW